MKLYVMRHGQTTYNAARRVAGQTDVPLNEEGILQAKMAAHAFPEDCTVIISSDLVRCRQTTDILNEGRNLLVTYDARLRERNFGSLNGKGFDDSAFGGDFWAIDRRQEYDYRPHGGESAEDVSARLSACLDEIREKGGVPLLVTSAGIVLMLQHRLHGKAQDEHVANGSIHEFEWE